MIVAGVDIGTQSLKVVVVDGNSRLATAQSCYPILHPKASWAEQDPRVWEKALHDTVSQVLHIAKLDKRDVKAVAIAGQLDGCIAVDGDDNPLSNCLLWMDRRAVDGLPQPESMAAFRLKTGLVMDASHMAAKIQWLQRHGPVDAKRYHQPASYLLARLCGAFVYDHGLASTSMLYNLQERAYDDELLALFEISRHQIPQIANANTMAGALSKRGAERCGLQAGTPIAVGTGDDFATLLGAGPIAPGALYCVLGTAEVVGALHPTALIDELLLVQTHPFFDHYLLGNPGWLSGGALRWLRELLKIDSDHKLDELAATAPIGCDGLTFIPALSGAMAPEWQASARGCFYGLTSHHGRGHMARSVLEGTAFAMRDVRTRLLRMGVPCDSIHLLGGGARSGLWSQIRADLCQAKVDANASVDSCAIGAALLARSAVSGETLQTIVAGWPHDSTEFVPRAASAPAYDEAYLRYQSLFEALRPMWTQG